MARSTATPVFCDSRTRYNKMIGENWSAGISIYGNGGMNTN
jgi:hypothetical protein